MELAGGYLNPNSSYWKSVPLFTKDMNSDDDKNEDHTDEEEKKKKIRELKRSGNTVRKQTQKKHKVIVTLP
jgi:hypothetical protein